MELPPSWLSPRKSCSCTPMLGRGTTMCAPPGDLQCPSMFPVSPRMGEEVSCAGSRLQGALRQHPKPAQQPFHPQPCLSPGVKFLPQDPPSWGGCRHQVPVLTYTLSPFFSLSHRLGAGRRLHAAQCASLFTRPRAGLWGMAGNRLHFLLEFYYIHRINK